MLRTYNCGVGLVAIVAAADVDQVLSLINDPVTVIGHVENRINGMLIHVYLFSIQFTVKLSKST